MAHPHQLSINAFIFSFQGLYTKVSKANRTLRWNTMRREHPLKIQEMMLVHVNKRNKQHLSRVNSSMSYLASSLSKEKENFSHYRADVFLRLLDPFYFRKVRNGSSFSNVLLVLNLQSCIQKKDKKKKMMSCTGDLHIHLISLTRTEKQLSLKVFIVVELKGLICTLLQNLLSEES